METFDFLGAPSLDSLLNMPGEAMEGRRSRGVEDKRKATSTAMITNMAVERHAGAGPLLSTSPEDTEASTNLAGES